MKAVTSAVREALSKECWLPALTLALTIPDIGGQVEYPEFVNKEGRLLVGKQYREWFNNHVAHFFADETGFDEDCKPMNPYFTGDMCYQLRCSVLHSGQDVVDFEFGEKVDGFDYEYEFEIRLHACDNYGEWWFDSNAEDNPVRHVHVRIDLEKLCNSLCDAADRRIDELKTNEFSEHEVRIVDIQARLQRLNGNR